MRVIKFLLIFLLLSIIFVNCNKINKKEIEIDSNPPSAKLFIDKKYLGETPVKITLNIGKYTIELEKEDFKVLKEKINVSLFGKKRYLYNLEKIPLIYSKKFNINNINLIKSCKDYVYLASNDLIIYKLNLPSSKIVEKKDLKEINTNELNCYEDESDKYLIKFDINKYYTPKETINLFLNIKTYLLKSSCQKIFEKRVNDVKGILNLIIRNKELTEKLLNSLKNNFLEMSWIVNEIPLPVESKNYIKFYGEFYKNDLACFYIQNLYLKKLEIKEISIPYDETPLEWVILGKYLPGTFAAAINFYDTITLKKIDKRWYIIEIKNSEMGSENLPIESGSFFFSSSYDIFPDPPKIKDILPLPDDIKNCIDKAKAYKTFVDKVRNVSCLEDNVFITTYLYLYSFDNKFNFIDRYLSCLPLNPFYGLRIIFVDNNKIKITYNDLKNKIQLWENSFNTNFMFFLNELDNELLFLELNQNSIYLIKINKDTGIIKFRKEILRIDSLEQNFSYPFFKTLKNKFLLFNNNKVYLFNFKGEVLWEKDFKENVDLLNSSEDITAIVQNKTIFILDTINGKLLSEINVQGDVSKIYLSNNFILYIERVNDKNLLTYFDLNKNEKKFILKVYDENVEIVNKVNKKLLIYKLNKNTINVIDVRK